VSVDIVTSRLLSPLGLDAAPGELRLHAVGAGEMSGAHGHEAHARAVHPLLDRLRPGLVALVDQHPVELRTVAQLVDEQPLEGPGVARGPGGGELVQHLGPALHVVEHLPQHLHFELRRQVGEEAELLLHRLQPAHRLVLRPGRLGDQAVDAEARVVTGLEDRQERQVHRRVPGPHRLQLRRRQPQALRRRRQPLAVRRRQPRGERPRRVETQPGQQGRRSGLGRGVIAGLGEFEPDVLALRQRPLHLGRAPGGLRFQKVHGSEQVDRRVGVAQHPQRRLPGDRAGGGEARQHRGADRHAQGAVAQARQNGLQLAHARPSSGLVLEDVFDLALEEPGDLEGERQGRVVLAGLQRVHRLPRYVEPFRQIGLAPFAFGAENPESILHVDHRLRAHQKTQANA
jgi:hypothetical protein